MDSRHLLAMRSHLRHLVGAWMFRYEVVGNGGGHVNRFTGAICAISEECCLNSN